MLTKNLYKRILISPLRNDVNQLFILSGFASSTFARKNLIELIKNKPNIKVKLIIGMERRINEHIPFLNLVNDYNNNFSVFYYTSTPRIHSKLYIWLKDKKPLFGFAGSANYTQYGFSDEKQGNQMSTDEPQEMLDYFYTALNKSLSIQDNQFKVKINDIFMNIDTTSSVTPGTINWIKEDEIVKISFLDTKGNLPERSGLNWGQRENREPNQAYLSLKKDSRKEGFLPQKKFTFTMLTDDGASLDCVVQQQSRKGVSTTYDNSILGKYIRNRIGVREGELIKSNDLIKYGRTDFTLKKIDNENFLFDFSIEK